MNSRCRRIRFHDKLVRSWLKPWGNAILLVAMGVWYLEKSKMKNMPLRQLGVKACGAFPGFHVTPFPLSLRHIRRFASHLMENPLNAK